MSRALLPPVAPEVLAEAVEGLTARLRRRLDAAIAECGAGAVTAAEGSVSLRFGEDAVVTLRPGPAGTITEPGQASFFFMVVDLC
ncbi:hypothetical protein ACFWAO_39375, partial [Streptomyces sp. NPDC059981]